MKLTKFYDIWGFKEDDIIVKVDGRAPGQLHHVTWYLFRKDQRYTTGITLSGEGAGDMIREIHPTKDAGIGTEVWTRSGALLEKLRGIDHTHSHAHYRNFINKSIKVLS